ncbi:MAG: riboflavin biosynthesis protein RibF, partial [Candidatus Omnitrophica bacterium]|nr:riboflavin biosynthesis protein RibF [Candidatus Omnitrophota bacterium]
HRGHKLILEKLKYYSIKYRLTPLVITFSDLPEKFIHKEFCGYLMDAKDKMEFISNYGIPCIWEMQVTKEFLNISKEDFLKYSFPSNSIDCLLLGSDFRFGKNGSGDINFIKKFCVSNDIKLKVFKKKEFHGRIVSSTLIRRLIRRAEFAEAEKFLQREYFVRGTVISGKGIGKTLGFPTANIDYDGYVIPSSGVYAGKVEVAGKTYLAAVNIGRRPTIGKHFDELLEAHIIGFDGEIVGDEIKLFFLRKIRNERKFADRSKLKDAISRDVISITRKFNNRV